MFPDAIEHPLLETRQCFGLAVRRVAVAHRMLAEATVDLRQQLGRRRYPRRLGRMRAPVGDLKALQLPARLGMRGIDHPHRHARVAQVLPEGPSLNHVVGNMLQARRRGIVLNIEILLELRGVGAREHRRPHRVGQLL